MAPYLPGSVVKYSVPTVIILLSYFLFRRRKTGVRSDTGGSKPIEENFKAPIEEVEELEKLDVVHPSTRLSPEKITRAQSTPISTPNKASSPNRKFNRSLSGVETAPIDIVYPPELRSAKSTPVVIPDEDLDLEIEKIKSMRNQYNSPSSIAAHLANTPSPKTESQNISTDSPPDSLLKSPNTNVTVKEEFEQEIVKENADKKMTQENNTTPSKLNTTKKNKSKNKDKKQDKSPEKVVDQVERKLADMKVNDEGIIKKEDEEVKMADQTKTDLTDHSEVHRKNSGRDSANHSPSDVMMGSPSLSSMSDNHSEGSSDSGKGGSDVATPPPSRTPQMTASNMPVNYEFVIPQNLVGKLIGRHGFFVQNIREKCNANVYVKKHPTNNKFKLCSIEGSQAEVDNALKMIREKFPLKKYSEVTLEQVQLSPVVDTIPLVAENLYLKLIEGINNDTCLSTIVTPNHLFMQLPTHPSFPTLNILHNCMNNCYNATDTPLLPSPIPENTLCAAFSMDSWYRALIISTDEESESSYVKFLDYGGYYFIENSNLRQIRQDFMLLPFQAAECYLSNIEPAAEDGTWSPEANKLVADVANGSIIYTQVVSHSSDGVPLVYCYVVDGNSVVFLNQRLVDDGFAKWIEFDDELRTITQESEEEAVVA